MNDFIRLFLWVFIGVLVLKSLYDIDYIDRNVWMEKRIHKNEWVVHVISRWRNLKKGVGSNVAHVIQIFPRICKGGATWAKAMTDMEQLTLANLDDDVEDAYEYHPTTRKLKVVRKSRCQFICCGVLLALCVLAIVGLCVTLGIVVLELKSIESQSASSSETSSSSLVSSRTSATSKTGTSSSTSSPSPSPTPTLPPPTSSLCLTESCVQLAGNIISNMDSSVDPCNDFYNYSCGGWGKKNVLPEGYGRWSRFSELDEQNRISLRHIIENDLLENIPAISYARQLYYSCMNLSAIDSESLPLLLSLLNSSGGWDLVGVHNGKLSTEECKCMWLYWHV